MWGALFDEKSGLYFSVFPGHRQSSLSGSRGIREHILLSLFFRLPQLGGPMLLLCLCGTPLLSVQQACILISVLVCNLYRVTTRGC
jgi:hypothetical protein